MEELALTSNPVPFRKRLCGTFSMGDPDHQPVKALAIKDLDPRTPGLQGMEGTAREDKSWTQDTQDGGAKLGPEQTQSSWMSKTKTKSWQRTPALSPHFLP